MTQRIVDIPKIGQVVLSKRKGARHIRLSVTAAGVVRVGLPNWVPYSAGVEFAKSRAEWIQKHAAVHRVKLLEEGQHIGKAHRLHFYQKDGLRGVASRVTDSEVKITSSLEWDSQAVQAKARQACERALKQEANTLLPQKLASLAAKHGFKYKNVRILKLTSRWGSCSSTKTISLSYYLIQLPWQLIDYVLVHELVHTEHLNHGADFWSRFESVMPGAKALRKQIRTHQPRVEAQQYQPL